MFAQVKIVNCLFLRRFRLARVLSEILGIFSNELNALFEKSRFG